MERVNQNIIKRLSVLYMAYKYFLFCSQQIEQDSFRHGNRIYVHRCVRPTLYRLHHTTRSAPSFLAVKVLSPKCKHSLDISHQIFVLISASSCPGFQTSCLALNFFVKFSSFVSAAIHLDTIKFSPPSFMLYALM